MLHNAERQRLFRFRKRLAFLMYCYLYCLRFKCSVEQYVNDLPSYHAHLASESLRFFCDYLNDHNLSLKTIISAYSSAVS